MFPSLRELNPPVSSHEGPYLKARRLRNVKAPTRRSPLFDGQPKSNATLHHAPRSAGARERMLPKRATASAAASDSDLSRCGVDNGSYEEVTPLSSNKFSPTTFFKKLDSDVKASEVDVLKRRKRSIPINNRTVWNADVLVGGDAKEMLSPSTQQQRLAVQLKRVEDAKEKIIRRDLQSLRQSKSITLSGGEATLVIRDHKKMPPVGFIKVSPDKMTQAGKDLYLGKMFEKPTHSVIPPVESSETAAKPGGEDKEEKPNEVNKTQDDTINVPTAALENSDDDNDRDESSTRMPKKSKKKDNVRKRTTVAVREKRAKARERRRNHLQEPEPTGETPSGEKRQPKPGVASSSESDNDSRNSKKRLSAKSGGEMNIAAAQLARQPPRLRKLLKKKMDAAQQQGDNSNAEPPKPVRVTIREVSDLIAFVDLETKNHVKKFFSESNVDPDSNIEFATLSQFLPSSLNEDMLKYLRTLYDYFRLLTTCSIKESYVLAAVAKRLGSKKSLLGKVRLKRPVDEISPGDVKEFMVKFSSCELCGQVTSSKLLEVLTSNTPNPERVIVLEDNMETYLCKDNPRLLHKLDFFAYLPFLLSL